MDNKTSVLKVVRRPMLIPGQLATDPSGGFVILIDSEQADEDQAATFWHEAVHAVLLMYGITEQDESRVESVAQALVTAGIHVVFDHEPENPP